MTDFEIGARYEWKRTCEARSGTLLSVSAEGTWRMERDDGVRGGGPNGEWLVFPVLCDYLRRLPGPEAVVAEGDRLFEGDKVCCLCGSSKVWAKRTDGPHVGSRYCNRKQCIHEGALAVDAEITRRRALAQPVPPASEATAQNVPGSAGSADVPTREDGAATPLGEAKHNSAQPVEPERPDPYAEHRKREELGCLDVQARERREAAQSRTAAREPDQFDRIATARRRHLDQLKAELDRPVRRDKADWDARDAEEIYVS